MSTCMCDVCDMLTPQCKPSHVPHIHQNIITHQYHSTLALTCLRWLWSGTRAHTQTHMGVYHIFNTLQVLLCHLRFALRKDTNSRLTQTLKLLWRGLFLVLSLPVLNFLFLLSPPLKGIDTGLPCSTDLKKSPPKSIMLYFDSKFSVFPGNFFWILCFTVYISWLGKILFCFLFCFFVLIRSCNFFFVFCIVEIIRPCLVSG